MLSAIIALFIMLHFKTVLLQPPPPPQGMPHPHIVQFFLAAQTLAEALILTVLSPH